MELRGPASAFLAQIMSEWTWTEVIGSAIVIVALVCVIVFFGWPKCPRCGSRSAYKRQRVMDPYDDYERTYGQFIRESELNELTYWIDRCEKCGYLSRRS